MESKQKVLILNSYPHIGGAEMFIIGLALGLKEKGWEVYLALRQGSDFIQEALRFNLPVWSLPMEADFDLKTEKILFRLHKQYQFDLVFSTDERSARLGGVFAKLHSGIPHIARLRTVWDPHSQEKFSRRFRYRLGYWFLINLIITNSSAAERDLIKNYKIPASKVKVVYNGINLPHIMSHQFVKGNFREELQLPENAFVISHIGRISPPKNQLEAIEAAELIFEQVPNAYLILVGKPVHKEYFQKVLKKRNTSPFKERIFILGHRNDISQILLDTNVLLSTSTAEGLPNVMIEAGFFGKPVVGRDVNGNGEIISNGINGYLLPEEVDAEAFGEALLRIYKNPRLAEKMGRNAQQIVQKRFSYEKMIENYFRIFNSLVKSEIGDLVYKYSV